MTYLLNFIFVVFYYFLIKKLWTHKWNTIFFVVLGIHIITFRALANPYNYVDTLSYATAFDSIRTMSFRDIIDKQYIYGDWEVGYVILNWVVGHFTENPQVLFMVLAVIGISPVMWFYYKMSYSPLLTIVIYLLYPMFFYMGFGVIRQHIAVGFILLALYYVDNLKYSLFWWLLAVSFHNSAFVFFPFYFWLYFNKGGKNMGKSIFLILLILTIVKLSYVEVLSWFNRYQTLYAGKSQDNNIVPVAFIGSFVILFWWTKFYKCITDKLDQNLWNFMLYGLTIGFLGIGVYGMGRMTLYFMYAFPVVITLLAKYQTNKLLILGYNTIVLIAVIFLLILAYSQNPYTYSFYWEKQHYVFK